ncbi:Srp72p [Coemansia sp. RSA 1939]|nr:Srp72p [Coemansia sp. RSA 1939]KAJ2598437.1 Srp72p [Coemansia sp. RSA 1804]
MATTQQPLESYYSAIRDAISKDNLPLVIEKASAGLKDHPEEAEFIKIEIVALIKLENSASALDKIRKARTAKLVPVKTLQYEEAYCQFMLGKYDESRNILQRVKPSKTVDCLLAQIAYKCEQFSECVEIYERLISTVEPDGQEYNDIVLNLAAARAAKAQQDGVWLSETGSNIADGSYELLFNMATRLLACGRAKEAIKILDTACANAKITLSGLGWSDSDIRTEVGAIRVQKAVALQILGHDDEAKSIYLDLLSQKSIDRIASDIVIHNTATIRARGSASSGFAVDRVKRLLQIPGHSVRSLTRVQQALMNYNMAVVLLHQGQYFAARRVLRLLGKRFSDVALPDIGTASAIASLNIGSPHKALNEFLALSHIQSAVEGVFATLAATQVSVGLGGSEQSVSVLQEWLDKAQSVKLSDLDSPDRFVYYYFGIGVLLAWLSSNKSSGETTSSAAVNAAEHLYALCKSIDTPSPELLVAVGDCLAYSGDIAGARACFERANIADAQQSENMLSVLERSGHNKKPVQVILKDYNRRKKVLRNVPGVSTRFARQFQPRVNTTFGLASRPSLHEKTITSSQKGKHRAQRLRKLRRNPPKDYDPARKLDTERWIPLRQRSYYKPRGRNRKQQALRGGAQGGALEAESGLGGTGSARISGGRPENDYDALDSVVADADMETEGGKQKANKPKAKGKGKGKGKGKKGAW